MGAQQSSDRGGTAGAASEAQATAKTCYYDLLGVERAATDDEIKRAYRKKALELHPDRNFHNVEVATQRFAEIQAAYEVLSDPQERAWYDSHRETILSGQEPGDGGAEPTTFRNVRLTTVEDIMGLIRRFNATVPFDDEPTGFYGIARETFEHLALEEDAASEFGDIDIPEYPTFGSSDDGYEAVVKPFYAAWASFSTAKTFSWKDKYRLSDAPDRRTRRLMEKENKRFREEATREFNDTVRFLVGFVRKRDPRYLPNSQTDAQRQEHLRNAAAAQAARSRAANQEKIASYQLPEWAQSKTDEEGNTADLSGSEGEQSEEEIEIEVLDCVVCNKIFKSEKQLEAHERSKKHIKAVQQLRRQMKREGLDLDLDNDVAPTVTEGASASPSLPHEDEVEERPDANSHSTTNPAPLKSTSTTSSNSEEEDSNDASDSNDYAPRSVVEQRIASSNAEQSTLSPGPTNLDENISLATEGLTVDDKEVQADEADDLPPQPKKIGKAKAKRERKAKAQQDNLHQCSVCRQPFASRTKLFTHIRESNHAAPITTSVHQKSGKRKP